MREVCMWQKIKEEPVLFQGLLQAFLALLMAFGLKLDATKIGAILAFSAAVLSFVTRQVVTPTANPRASDGTKLVPQTSGMAAD